MIMATCQQHFSGDGYIKVVQESILIWMMGIYTQSIYSHIVLGFHKVWKYTQIHFSIINLAIKEGRRKSTLLHQTNYTLTAHQF